LPGQVIQVRWWQTDTESGGKAQSAIGGEPTGELGEDRQIGVEPDPVEPTDSEGE
jgi:hypothetical protein